MEVHQQKPINKKNRVTIQIRKGNKSKGITMHNCIKPLNEIKQIIINCFKKR